MKLRTELIPSRSLSNFSIGEKVVTIGSCFSDDIGKKLVDHKFNVLANPFGNIYNPVSIHKILSMALKESNPDDFSFLEREGAFFHFDFHSDWNDTDQSILNKRISEQLSKLREALLTSKFLIITYGTAWVYENKETKTIVANCHKKPQEDFEKFLLTQKMIIESFERFHEILKKLNPDCQLILTVSPVRHIKDTLELNSVSKSILRLTCDTLTKTFSNIFYFPAFEIMMDDLRDYRFYKPDMIHPSDQSVDYIWTKFSEVFFKPDTQRFVQEWKNILAALHHHPFRPDSPDHQKFLLRLMHDLGKWKDRVNVEQEIESVKRQLR
jgi:GSCFA family